MGVSYGPVVGLLPSVRAVVTPVHHNQMAAVSSDYVGFGFILCAHCVWNLIRVNTCDGAILTARYEVEWSSAIRNRTKRSGRLFNFTTRRADDPGSRSTALMARESLREPALAVR
jgi:hypothetical protein